MITSKAECAYIELLEEREWKPHELRELIDLLEDRLSRMEIEEDETQRLTCEYDEDISDAYRESLEYRPDREI